MTLQTGRGVIFFLIPADVYASGFTGVAQLLSSALDQYSPIYFSTGTLLFILNIPVGILGWMKVGRSFTIYSVLSVALTTVFLGMHHFSVDGFFDLFRFLRDDHDGKFGMSCVNRIDHPRRYIKRNERI